MKKNIKTVAELIQTGFAATSGDESQIEFHLKELAEDAKSLQDNLAKLEDEKTTLASKVAEFDTIKADNTKLSEQVTALDNALNKAKESSKELPQVANQLAEKETEISTLKAQLASLEVENQLDKGISNLVFDVNDKARNARMADLCKSDWKAQYKVEKREDLLVVIDKKTQKEDASSVSESIETFAKENGYTVKVGSGLNISAELGHIESNSTASVSDITFEDAQSADPKRKEAYHAKKADFAKKLAKEGIATGSEKYTLAMIEEGLMNPEGSKYAKK